MSTMIYTARRCDLGEALCKEARLMLAREDDSDVFVVVPNQLTLETETALMEELQLKGSFRLNVVSPKRLCGRVFEECGRPTSTVIDERGRAMLMGYLLRQNEKKLKLYASSASRAGFESKLVEEISRFRQAGVDSAALKSLPSEGMDDRMRAKLADLSLLYEEYENRIAGSVQDGEQEMAEATERMAASVTLKNAAVLVYGFDITTASINLLIAGLAAVCREVRIFIPLPSADEGDAMIYEPQLKALERLKSALIKRNVAFTVKALTGKSALSPTQATVRRLYAMPVKKQPLGEADLLAKQLNNPLSEARYVAAGIRELVRTRGYHYNDFRVVVEDADAYADVIDCAFREYEIPYFSQSAMKASVHPLCRFLNESLAILSGSASGVGALCETGFTSLDADEQETLIEYCEALKIRTNALLKPFYRGSQEMLEAAEPLRQKLTAPLKTLREGMRGAETLNDQLKCIYAYLSETGCFEKYVTYMEELKQAGESTLAQDEVRINNLLIDTFDQMNELLGPKPLSVSAVADLIARALDAVIVKVLPQSPDAVEVSGPQRCGIRHVKSVFLMHAVSSEPSGDSGIFEEAEMRLLTNATQKYLAPTPIELAQTDRMYIKDALCLASDAVRITFPSGAMDGSALMSGALISELKRIISDYKPEGGVDGDKEADKMRLSSPKGAMSYIATEFSSLPGDDASVATALKLMEESGALKSLKGAAAYANRSERLDRELARQLYFKGTSITRLEKYAGCPFAHFVEQGLRPARQRAFQIDPLNRGNLLHECMELFIKAEGIERGSEQEAMERMAEIFDGALQGEIAPYAHDSNASMFEVTTLKRVALRAATLLYRQLKTGVFHPVDVEVGFGAKGRRFLKLSEDVHIDGRIDRVDMGVHEGNKYVFVVDYKSGYKKPEPAQILAGLQLQLLVYLAVAMSKYDASAAGVYYFCMQDEPVRTDSTDRDEIEEKRTKDQRMKGIAPSDVKLLRDIADEPQNVISVNFNKDGSLSANQAAANQEEFEALIRHAARQCRKFTEEIMSGNTEISPASSSSMDACTYCDYADICLKDRLIGGVRRRKLSRLKFSELMEAVRQ